LATGLLMFPQIVETIYSPALPLIARGFSATAEQAAQTLSFYFLAFAFGVVVWGRLCDYIGRRPAMLLGLLVYSAASVAALLSQRFEWLLAARMLAAFGASVGSIGTQTILRDTFTGTELTKVFSVVGIALAASPAVGMVIGAGLSEWYGYQGVFAALAVLAAILFSWSAVALPETRPAHSKAAPLVETLSMMLRNPAIWRTALLVALFNLGLFGYYQLAPFDFERLGLSTKMFGYSGLALACGAALGAILNKSLLRQGWNPERLVVLAAALTLAGGVMVTAMASSKLFVLPMMLVVLAYGVAIPNILATALVAYRDRLGTAGALLGLLYYLMLGGGLVVTAWGQRLGLTLVCCGIASVCLAIAPQREALVANRAKGVG
jgi:Bcr/CflA subfamily drug resistance transporter